MWFENVATFVTFGFEHIIPDGPDHVLFVIALYLNARSLGALILQVTVFTLAHTLSLLFASTGAISVPADIVEPLIALSIPALAVEAIFLKGEAAWRLPVIFAFGLLHGLGYGSLMAPALQTADLSAGLVGITLGVELGHMTVLLAAALVAWVVRLILKAASKPDLYRPAFVFPVAAVIALIGFYWTLQRVGLLPE